MEPEGSLQCNKGRIPVKIFRVQTGRIPSWTYSKADVYRGTTVLSFNLVSEAIGTAATPGLMCQPRVIVKMIVEKQMECRLTGESEVLGENLPQRHFCPSQNPTWPGPGLNQGRRADKPATNRLSYGAALLTGFVMGSF
jgi:hypothetical protein